MVVICLFLMFVLLFVFMFLVLLFLFFVSSVSLLGDHVLSCLLSCPLRLLSAFLAFL